MGTKLKSSKTSFVKFDCRGATLATALRTSSFEIREEVSEPDKKFLSSRDSFSRKINFVMAEESRYQFNIVARRASPKELGSQSLHQ